MFEAPYSIPYAGIGPDGRMKLPVLLDILQDMADRDAHRMAMTVSDLLPKGVSWVLRRYRVTMERYPEYESTLTVKTWHEPRRNLHSLRAFSVTDENGPVASAETSWILIDLERGRPLRLDRHATPRYVEESRPVTAEFPDLPSPDNWEDERPFSVRRWDLDRNNHVNNAVYFSWAAEAVPEETAKDCSLVRVDAEYLRPTEGRGDIRVRTARHAAPGAERVYVHSIVGPDGDEKARFITCWKRRM
ncbi:acyl-ACP thioesterase [Aminivibrio pyruvatiphilus]|jgi:acyl-ACP thioesterase|uniref:Acyl-ACP thioesterase n=1 Tax=Aminivibrio pyruvatiphilus TaxID=1005740 RepID=A0A4R8M820_9BACT|nr:acyl-ACP thioesterase domain-containing protein [Aminivibrio pyruvatiphilus]TDY61669.1 acyl-ACP thioesterase [Aminivibrio pyruvatiphilus]